MARQSPMRELHGGRGGRRQAVRAGFLGARQLQHHVGLLGQRRVGARGDGDQRHLEAARVGQDVAELHALARPGQRHDGVVARDHAEVAVAGLARMHEEGRRAGRGEGGGDLLGHVPALADAGDDHAALGGGERRHGPAESRAQFLVERAPQALQALAFEVERACGRSGCVRWRGFHHAEFASCGAGGHGCDLWVRGRPGGSVTIRRIAQAQKSLPEVVCTAPPMGDFRTVSQQSQWLNQNAGFPPQ